MNKLDIFCGIGSLGLPFPRENSNHIGYYDIVVQTLKSKGYVVSGFNGSRLNQNHTWNLEDDLNSNVSLAYVRNLQIQSLDNLRNTNILFKLIVPQKYSDVLKQQTASDDIRIKDMYASSEQPIFLYFGGPNDFFSYIKAGPVELLSKEVRDNLPKDIDSLIKQSVDNVKKNWELLYQLNPNTKIYALSFYYSPLYDKIQKLIFLQQKSENENAKSINRFAEAIDLYNKLLEEASMKYDYVDYCDITFVKDYCAPMDFHPNTDGNKLIADLLLKKIEMQIDINNQFIASSKQ